MVDVDLVGRTGVDDLTGVFGLVVACSLGTDGTFAVDQVGVLGTLALVGLGVVEETFLADFDAGTFGG